MSSQHPADMWTNSDARVDSEINLQVNLQLLRDIHGFITHSLSTAGGDGCKPLIHAKLVTLGLALGSLSPTLHEIHGFKYEQLQKLDGVLQIALHHLDTIVTDQLLAIVDEQGVLKSASTSEDSQKLSFAKLMLLRDVRSSRYKSVSAITKETDLISDHETASDQKLLGCLNYNLPFNEQRQILSAISHLNEDLEKLIAPTQRDNAQQNTNIDDESAEVESIRQAQKFREQVSLLYQVLADGMGDCHTDHKAQLCLSKFGIDNHTLDIFISMCNSTAGLDAATPLWHPTQCSIKDKNRKAAFEEGLCKYLHTAQLKRLPATFNLSEGSLSKVSMVGTRLAKDDHWSFVDLATLLGSSNIEGQTKNITCVESPDARRLQCLLAQSLLFLHPSLWMPEVLDLTNINFAFKESTYDLKNPYMYTALRRACADHIVDSEQTSSTANVVDFMIYFGLLLLQIEVGKQLPISEEDKQEQYGHEIALQGYYEQYAGRLDARFKKVLEGCLDFEGACLEHVSRLDLPADLRARLAVSQYIVEPLKESLAFNYPDIAAEIPAHVAEHQRKPDVNKPARGNLTAKRKPEFGSVELPPLLYRKVEKVFDFLAAGIDVSPVENLKASSSQRNWTATAPLEGQNGLMVKGDKALSSARWFDRLETLVNVLRPDDDDEAPYTKPVKIAVIDSGLSPDHPAFEEGKYRDFVTNPRPPNTHDVKHGTDTVDLILRVFEPAELYIARVFEDKDATEQTALDMVKAIEWCIEKKVDIINISAGFQQWPKELETAINTATGGQHEILVFAAAGNYSHTDPIAYPAQHKDRVMGMFSTNGGCKNSQRFNPKFRNKADNFAVLGEDVFLNPSLPPLSGTSISTAIASGLAGRFLSFGRQKDTMQNISRSHKLATKAGMTAVFQLMSKDYEDGGYDCMCPWSLLPKDHEAMERKQIRRELQREIQKVL